MALDSPPGEPDDAEDAVPPLPPPVVYRHVRAIAARSKCRRPIHLPAFRSPCIWRDRHRRIPPRGTGSIARSEEHTSELQSLVRISYAVFCLKKKKSQATTNKHNY